MSWHGPIERSSNLPEDVDSVTVIGIRSDQTEEVLMNVSTTANTDISTINASEFPYLQLTYHTADSASRTAGQLRNWHVFFQPVPEVALNPFSGYLAPEENIKAGEELSIGISLDNISDYDFDTLAVDYWVQDATGEIVQSRELWLSGPEANTTRLDTIQFSSRNLSGDYSIWMRANPMDERWQN